MWSPVATRTSVPIRPPIFDFLWSGTVYVSCDARVAKAELDADSNPLFLKGCNLEIAPHTVVYVAAHNDAPYSKGCSCHTGLLPNLENSDSSGVGVKEGRIWGVSVRRTLTPQIRVAIPEFPGAPKFQNKGECCHGKK